MSGQPADSPADGGPVCSPRPAEPVGQAATFHPAAVPSA
jgi:hypothetical protein